MNYTVKLLNSSIKSNHIIKLFYYLKIVVNNLIYLLNFNYLSDIILFHTFSRHFISLKSLNQIIYVSLN